MADKLVDKLVDGRFKISALLGEGGVGTVYKAQQLDLSRPVAIKFLHSDELITEENQARFEREAKILASFENEHIVRIYSAGLLEQRRLYLVMEYLDGKTLARILLDESPLPWQRAVNILVQLCQAMQYAHVRGVIHRDLKPQNIMLQDVPSKDFAKILDFGLSKFLIPASGKSDKLTHTGTLLGSVHYMAPEMCQGLSADARSDVYSLGCILYEALAGHVPLDADHPIGLLHKQVTEMPPSLPASVPKALQLLVFKALQKEPSDRFQTTQDFENALIMIQDGRGHEINYPGLKLGKNIQSGKSYTTTKAVALGGLMLATVLVTIVYLSVRIKGDLEFKNAAVVDKFVSAAFRKEQIKRARNYIAEARAHVKSGKMSLAEQPASRAIITLAQPYSGAAQNKVLSLYELETIKDLAGVVSQCHLPRSSNIGESDATLKNNNEQYLDDSDFAELCLDLATISRVAGNYIDSMTDIDRAVSNFAGKRQFQKCREVIASIEKLETQNETQKESKCIYLELARMRLDEAEGKTNSAITRADQIMQLLGRTKAINPFTIQMIYGVLFGFELHHHNSDAVMKCALATKEIADSMLITHPEVYKEALYRLFNAYLQKGDLINARIQLQEMENYGKKFESGSAMRKSIELLAAGMKINVAQ